MVGSKPSLPKARQYQAKVSLKPQILHLCSASGTIDGIICASVTLGSPTPLSLLPVAYVVSLNSFTQCLQVPLVTISPFWHLQYP